MRAELVHQGQGSRQAEPGHGPREGWVYGLLAVLSIIIVSTTAGGAKDRSPLPLRYPPLHQEILYTCMYRCRVGGTFFFFLQKRKRTFHRLSFSTRSVGTEARISFLCVWLSRLSVIYHISYTPRPLPLCVAEHLFIRSSGTYLPWVKGSPEHPPGLSTSTLHLLCICT